MLLREVNSRLRGMVLNLISAGWNKTSIGRILLGSNGQAHLNHWLKTKEDGTPNDFGIKPLSRLAELIDYETHVVFVKKENNKQTVEYLENLNEGFIKEMQESCVNVLGNTTPTSKIGRKSRGQIDNVIDELLGESPDENSEDPIE